MFLYAAQEAPPVDLPTASSEGNPYKFFQGESNTCTYDDEIEEVDTVETHEYEETVEEKSHKVLTHFNGKDVVQLWSDSSSKKGEYQKNDDGFLRVRFEDGEIYETSLPNSKLQEDGSLNIQAAKPPKAKPKAKSGC